MARGWESKNIEAQQDEARRADSSRPGRGREEPPEVRARRRTLELARARAEADLLKACVPAHRDMLRQTLEAINAALQALSST